MPRLNVAILWHMHQPCYREPDSRVFRLPWARLHALKDYYDMPAMALEHPGLKVCFNLVPSLMEQLAAYADGSATDPHLELSRRRPGDLEEAERCFLLQEFFMANWDNMIRPRPRYWELLQKRGLYYHPSELSKICRRFSEQDLLDLQVLFNLAWTDPLHFERLPELGQLEVKARGFNEEEKARLFDLQTEIIRSIPGIYRRAAETGAAELSTSPFYHPILPLLCDSDAAAQCMPQAALPARFRFPQDASRQVRRALDYMEQGFGSRPKGMWPSEGSVSREAVEVMAGEGLAWIATDEGILERSLGRQLREQATASDPRTLYRPYRLDGAGPEMFFRDRILSDLIGFTYASWQPEEAAADILSRLEKTADALGDSAERHIVPIILDGENAWETYPGDGRRFLGLLYSSLSKSGKLRTCTFGEFLGMEHECGSLERLHPGSWIDSDFGIWIGREEDNKAWELLGAARQALEERRRELKGEILADAENEIDVAEGSDWCWWYGGNFDSEHLGEFDALFRSHIIKLFRLLEMAPPDQALAPISSARPQERKITEPVEMISPVIDGRSTEFYEWAGAGKLDTSVQGGTMHRSQSLIKALYFGFDLEKLYLRLDPADNVQLRDYPDMRISLEAVKPERGELDVPLFAPGAGEGLSAAWGDIIEIGVPFQRLGLAPGDKYYFYVVVKSDSLELEKHPSVEPLKIKIPDKSFVLESWQV